MIYGLDLLASAKYKNVAVKHLPKGWALGGFDNTFGDFAPVAKAVLKKGCPLIRVQMLWSDTHSFGDKDIPKLKKIAKKYEQLANQFPSAIIELSPFCEHNLQNPDKYLDIVKDIAPSCIPVNTPWKGALSKKYKNEVHGEHKKPAGAHAVNGFNFSFDGTNCVDEDVESYKDEYEECDVFFFWHPRFNLKWSMKDTTPRPQRKAKPSPELVQSIVYLGTPKGQVSVKKFWLVKSHAEKHDAGDLKGDKLLIISPLQAEKILLKAANGKVVETLNYYGTFEGGGYRYYSKRFGYQIAIDAFSLTKSNLCEIWVKGNKQGVCNPGFRDPTYR